MSKKSLKIFNLSLGSTFDLLSLKGNQGNLEKNTKELFESMINNREDYHVEEFEEVTANGSRSSPK